MWDEQKKLICFYVNPYGNGISNVIFLNIWILIQFWTLFLSRMLFWEHLEDYSVKSIQIPLVFAWNSQSSSVHYWFILVISLNKFQPLLLRFERICQWTPMGRDQVSFWKRQLCTCCGLKIGITLGWRHPQVGNSHPYETLISSQNNLSLFFSKSLLLCLWEFHSDPNMALIFTG